MRISVIAAIAGKKRTLGKTGGIPWKIPGEQKRFKEITMGHPIIMGRKTYESIGRPLPGRTNIVITRDSTFQVEGVLVVHSLDEALQVATSEIASASSSAKVIDPEAQTRRATTDKSPRKDINLSRHSEERSDVESDEVFVIGGGQIYEQALSKADKLYLTIIEKELDGDVFFPDYSAFKKVISEQPEQSKDYQFTFLELER